MCVFESEGEVLEESWRTQNKAGFLLTVFRCSASWDFTEVQRFPQNTHSAIPVLNSLVLLFLKESKMIRRNRIRTVLSMVVVIMAILGLMTTSANADSSWRSNLPTKFWIQMGRIPKRLWIPWMAAPGLTVHGLPPNPMAGG